MRVEDIIEGLNRHIEYKRNLLDLDTNSHLVLQRNNKPHTLFKAYKEYTYVLWFVKNGKKYEVIKVQITDKVLEGQEECMLRRMNVELCTNIFNIMNTDIYNQIIEGKYYGNKDE